MEVNNFDIIIPLLKINSSDEFYYLQILQRKKENPEIGSNSRVIRNYFIKSEDYLLKRKDEIIDICKTFNSRASIRLNKRSFERVAFKAIQNLANSMSNREFSFCGKSYDRACGQGHIENTPKWIIDIDGSDVDVFAVINSIEKCMPNNTKKHVATIPSKNGLHLITTPFNVQEFKVEFPLIDIHKDNPTNLYIP